MKATGVVRRIDELGRIVIPKEIRKNLTIKQGENLEIFLLDNDTIALKKYSILSRFSEISNILVDSLYQTLNKEVILMDTDNIINYKGKRKDLLNKEISSDITNILNDRRKVIDKNINLVDSIIEESYIIEPIIINGDLIGGIMIIDGSIDQKDIELLDYTTRILNNYIEL